MFPFITSLIFSFLEKIGLNWWQKHKQQEAENVENNVMRLDADSRRDSLRDNWTRK